MQFNSVLAIMCREIVYHFLKANIRANVITYGIILQPGGNEQCP